MIYLQLLMISIIIMYIIDKSGLLIDISKFIYEKINKKEWMGQIINLKPFTCSSCSIFWVILFYLTFNNYPIIFSLFLSVIYSSFINIIVNKLYDLIIRLIHKIK